MDRLFNHDESERAAAQRDQSVVAWIRAIVGVVGLVDKIGDLITLTMSSSLKLIGQGLGRQSWTCCQVELLHA